MTAIFSHDYADRESGLDVQVGADPRQTLVFDAAYKPGGPLTSLQLGNGLGEVRAFDGRYAPERIEVPGLLDAARYGYQDVQYFLTEGRGPWGGESWTYDRIGNRLTGASSAPTATRF